MDTCFRFFCYFFLSCYKIILFKYNSNPDLFDVLSFGLVPLGEGWPRGIQGGVGLPRGLGEELAGRRPGNKNKKCYLMITINIK